MVIIESQGHSFKGSRDLVKGVAYDGESKALWRWNGLEITWYRLDVLSVEAKPVWLRIGRNYETSFVNGNNQYES
jgi:hypothetical protein